MAKKAKDGYTGIIISFEGTDGSGKSTQVANLQKTLLERGYKVRKYKFPTYTLTGALAFGYLSTENDEIDSESLNGYQAASLYLVDMMCHAKEINDAVNKGEVVLIDRYVGSNYYQQAVRHLDIDSHSFDMQLKKFIHELDQMAYYMMKIAKPDLTFFMDVSPEFSKSIRDKDANRTVKDFHEKDESYLANVIKAGKRAAEIAKWNKIDCDYKSIEDISESVLREFEKEINTHCEYYRFAFN